MCNAILQFDGKKLTFRPVNNRCWFVYASSIDKHRVKKRTYLRGRFSFHIFNMAQNYKFLHDFSFSNSQPTVGEFLLRSAKLLTCNHFVHTNNKLTEQEPNRSHVKISLISFRNWLTRVK